MLLQQRISLCAFVHHKRLREDPSHSHNPHTEKMYSLNHAHIQRILPEKAFRKNTLIRIIESPAPKPQTVCGYYQLMGISQSPFLCPSYILLVFFCKRIKSSFHLVSCILPSLYTGSHPLSRGDFKYSPKVFAGDLLIL